MKGLSKFVWTAFFIVIVPLVMITVLSGLVVDELTIPGGFKIVFREKPAGISNEDKIEELPETELEQRQAELERRLQDFEQQAEESTISQQPTTVDLSGTWYSQTGLSYQIYQQGDSITFQEFHPTYGVTAVGQGQVQNQSVTVSYQTAAYTQGAATLTVSSDGRSLNGNSQDASTGYTAPMSLYR